MYGHVYIFIFYFFLCVWNVIEIRSLFNKVSLFTIH